MRAQPGYVYLLGNAGMPDLYKIGRTVGNPRHRAAQLSCASGVPFDFDLIDFAEVSDCVAAEKFLHEELDDRRVNERREFFHAENLGDLYAAMEMARQEFSVKGAQE